MKLKEWSLKKGILEIVRFRWLFAFLLFIVLVCCKVHFSSIGVYYDLFPTVLNQEEKENYMKFGKNRLVRGDEWMVHTPKYFSQKNNNFKMYSNRGSLGYMNEVLDYYAPVKDLTLIGKPFNLGYILFGNEYGLSFYFCMLLILLFMTAFEMFYILTKKSLIVSLIGMFLIGFSPAMQWWFVPHITIVFVYSMGLFSATYYFLISKTMARRLILSPVLVSAFVGFCLSIFPSCQVVCGFVVLFLLIAVLKRDKEFVSLNIKICGLMGIIFLISIGIILNFVISSKEDFMLILNTDYPGSRLYLGGVKKLEDIFPSFTSLFLPYKDYQFDNNCEISTFIHFAPLFLILYGRILSRLKEDKDKDIYVLNCLFIMVVVEIIFMCMGFSEFLAKITLFKYANRMDVCYGWTASIFSVYCFSIFCRKKNILKLYQCFLYPFLYAVFWLSLVDLKMRKYFSFRWILLEVFLFVLIVFLVFIRFKKLALLVSSGVMIICGFNVNPVCCGASPVFNHPISKFIENKVRENKDDLWLSLGEDSVAVGAFLLANGARVLSTTYFYPDMTEWDVLGSKKEDFVSFNRYAHHKFLLKEGETKIKLEYPDAICVLIDPVMLSKLNIKHLVISKEYFIKIENLLKIKLEKEFEQDNYIVLKL